LTNRLSVLVVTTLVALLPQSSEAQRRDKAEALDFLLFLQSVASQKMARVCERGVPGYRQQFDDLYSRWLAKHRARVARGESTFRKALEKKDQPYTDRAKLESIQNAMAELAQSPRDTSPITLDEQRKEVCEQILAELDAGL